MSTYTDLKNRVKETITVGFRPEDRVTTQKVRFYNEENEYWGSFSGRISGSLSSSGGSLSGMTSYGETLVDPVLKTSSGLLIELGVIGNQVEEISTDVYETIPAKLSSIEERLSGVPADAGIKISALAELVESFDGRLSSAEDGLSSISILLGVETSARLSANDFLSADYTALVGAEVSARLSADEKLEADVRELSSRFTEYAASETPAREAGDAAVSAFARDYADMSRHYSLHTMDAASSMPIPAEEFAVNRLLGYDVPDAFVQDSYNRIVGWVERYDAETGGFRFTAYRDADYEDAPYYGMLGLDPYIFDGTAARKRCADGQHDLVYGYSGERSATNLRFRLEPSFPDDRDLTYNGEKVGHVFAAGQGAVLSGKVQFFQDAFKGDPDLSGYFDTTDEIQFLSGETTRVGDGCTLDLDPARPGFVYKVGVATREYCELSGGLSVARVYKDTVEYDSGEVSAFAVALPGAAGFDDVRLDAESGFSAVVAEHSDSSFEVLSYDADGKRLSLEKKAARLSCAVTITDEAPSGDPWRAVMPLSAGSFNTELSDAETAFISFAPLSAAVGQHVRPLACAQYELTRNEGVLSCLYTSYDRGQIEVRLFNNGRIYVELSATDGNRNVFQDEDDAVDWTSGICEDLGEVSACQFDAGSLDFDKSEKTYDKKGAFVIGEVQPAGMMYDGIVAVSSFTPEYSGEYSVRDVVVELPNYKSIPSESREFMFTVRPVGTGDVELKFVREDGQPVPVFADHASGFSVKCGVFTTFRMQEIAPGRFSIIDWDQSSQEARIEMLEHGLRGEIEARAAAVGSLSAALSGEIDSLSTALSGEVDGLSAKMYEVLDSHDRRISAVSADVDTLSGAVCGLFGISGDVERVEQIVDDTMDDRGEGLPGLLKIRDEHKYEGEESHRLYLMSVLSGTIVLMKQS